MKKRKLKKLMGKVAVCFVLKDDISNIKSGMFWYEDDSFSSARIVGKKVKAIVELVEDGVIYGDLTASELFDIKEQYLPWKIARAYIEEFSYPCKGNEKIVWYDENNLVKVCRSYGLVRDNLKQLGKKPRSFEWTSTEDYGFSARMVLFDRGPRLGNVSVIENEEKYSFGYAKHSPRYVRPILALKV